MQPEETQKTGVMVRFVGVGDDTLNKKKTKKQITMNKKKPKSSLGRQSCF